MNKILFITNRNITTTSGELRLIKNRTQALYEIWGIQTDFIAVRNKNKLKMKREVIGNGSSIDTVPFSKYNLFSILSSIAKQNRKVKRALKLNEYKCVIVSGTLVLPLIPYVKKYNNEIKIVVDIHGATEELIEFKPNSKIKATISEFTYRVTKHMHKKYVNLADGAFVVSRALKNYLIQEYGAEQLRFYVVPCAMNRTQLDLHENVIYRRHYREHYNVTDSDWLFIYSGGVSPWQSIDQVKKVHEEIKMAYPEKKMKLLVLSHHADRLTYLGTSNDIMVEVDHFYVIISAPSGSLLYYQIHQVLCAGDFAFLLRGDYVTNHVAFPNKFLEYVASGMRIISTPYTCDVASYIQKYNIGTILDNGGGRLDSLVDYLKQASEYGCDFGQRQRLLNDLSFETTLSNFVDDIKMEGNMSPNVNIAADKQILN